MRAYPAMQTEPVAPRWNRASLAVLFFVLALLAVDLGQVIYRVLLPTEGWTYDAGRNESVNQVIFQSNVLGEPSPIHPGDNLLAVEGVGLEHIGSGLGGPAISDGWRVGQTVHYTVVRDGRTIILNVPLKGWTATGILAFALGNGSWIFLLSGLLMFAIGLFVLLKRPDVLAARALLLLGTAWLTSSISNGVVPDGPTTEYSAVFALTALLSYWIWGILLAPTVFVLSLTFPQPKRILRRWPWLAVLPYAVFWILTASFGWLGQIGFGLSGAFFVLSLLSVIHSAFTQRDAVSRAQMLWGLGGFLAMLLFYLPLFLGVFGLIGGLADLPGWLNDLSNALAAFGFPVFVASLAIAILRHRLFDIDVIIRRTLIYGLLTALLVLFYFVSVVVLQQLFGGLTRQGSDLAIIISTLAIAALFIPLRNRVQRLIDRRFYRRKYDAQKILAQFGATVRDEVDLQRLTDELLTVVEEAVQPTNLSLWMKKTDDRKLARNLGQGGRTES